MGHFAFGHAKLGGRNKGTPNKRTLMLSTMLEELGLDVPQCIAMLLPQLSPDRQMDVLLELMQYLFPKRKAVEISDKTTCECRRTLNIEPLSKAELKEKALLLAADIYEAVDDTFDEHPVSFEDALKAQLESRAITEPSVPQT